MRFSLTTLFSITFFVAILLAIYQFAPLVRTQMFFLAFVVINAWMISIGIRSREGRDGRLDVGNRFEFELVLPSFFAIWICYFVVFFCGFFEINIGFK